MPNAGKTMMIVGGVLLAITVVLNLISYFLLSDGTAFFTDPEDEKVGEGTGNFTAYLDGGKSYQVWTKEDNTDVEIFDPGEKRVYKQGSGMVSNDWIMEGEFTAVLSGEYRFAVDPPDKKAMVTNEIDKAKDMEENAGSWSIVILGVLFVACIGPMGFIILVAGMIIFFVGKNKQESSLVPPVPGFSPSPLSTGSSPDVNGTTIVASLPKTVTPLPTPYGKKACLSCGLQIDLKYSKCPYCEKPTSGKRSFWSS